MRTFYYLHAGPPNFAGPGVT